MLLIAYFVVLFGDSVSATPTDVSSAQQKNTDEAMGADCQLDSLLIMPEGPEKQKRIKNLEKRMLSTVSWTTGRWGFLSLHRWPRTDRLYTLHNKLTDSDWILLAEMYINFDHGRKDYSQKKRMHLESAMTVLLAMRGQRAIDALNNIIESKKTLWSTENISDYAVRYVKEIMESNAWSNLPEYKNDQEKACAAGEILACTDLGRLYERGEGVKQDYPRAKELYEKACVAGEMLACTGLGRLYDSGNGVGQDSSKAEELYQKACSVSNAVCNAVGETYKYGTDVKPDYFKAMKYYGKACNARYAKSCKSLGEFYFQGWGVEQDYAKAKEYYKKACDLGYQGACYEYRQLSEQ